MELQKEITALERREQIMHLIRELGSISVKRLSEQFGVSDMTIRRDLHLLETQGIVVVHYGGATLREADPAVQDFLTRQGQLDQDKICIARRAAASVKEGDVIYLDTSTTICHMLRFLPPVKLTIVTNSLPVMMRTYQNRLIKLYMAPGIYQEQYGGAVDYSTIQYLSGMHYDKAFFGVASLDAEFGASASREKESIMKHVVWVNAEESYLLTDHTKFGRKDLFKYNEVKDFERIFTDAHLDEEAKRAFAQHGGKIEICV